VISWLRNNSTATSGKTIQNGSISSLVLRLQNRVEHPAKYRCIAENSLGETYSNEATLVIRPQTHSLGVKKYLCSSISFPLTFVHHSFLYACLMLCLFVCLFVFRPRCLLVIFCLFVCLSDPLLLSLFLFLSISNPLTSSPSFFFRLNVYIYVCMSVSFTQAERVDFHFYLLKTNTFSQVMFINLFPTDLTVIQV